MHSEQLNELAKALAAAQGRLLPAVKDAQNPHLRNRYADLASCWDAIRACLPTHGLSVVQHGVTVDGRDYLRTTLLHESGQWIAGDTPLIVGEGKGINPMQVLGSAWTYARRYGLAAICGLTADDDDGNGAGHAPQRQPERRPDPPPQPQPANGNTYGPAGDEFDRLTGWWLGNLAKFAGPAETDQERASRTFKLYNHLVTAALKSDRGIMVPADVEVDGKRDQSKAIRALRGLCRTSPDWVRSEADAYWKATKATLTADTV